MLKFSTVALMSASVMMVWVGVGTAVAGGGGPLEQTQQQADQQQAQQAGPNAPAQLREDQPRHVDVLSAAHDDDEEVDVIPDRAEAPVVDGAPLIQVALLLDTSNSMDGLIDQAKGQLWMIVNRFAKADRDGLRPRFEIALFEYGNTNLPAQEGYLRQVVGFTDDLDALSVALFGLTTRGGDEYCGQVIDEALTRLNWSEAGNDFKAVYIAGNEPFTQGSVDYVGVCERAKTMGVLVNTIHCGDESAGISGMWQHGAQLAGGSFLTINQDQTLVHEPTPQDDELTALNARLNLTYIPYGQAGAANLQRQQTVDEQNLELSEDAGVQRIASKVNGLYKNGHWDLVDACENEDFDLSAVPDEQLPEAMRGKTLEEKRAYVAEKARQRAAIREAIVALSTEREAYLAQARAQRIEEEGDSFGSAVNRSVDEQIEARGFKIDKE